MFQHEVPPLSRFVDSRGWDGETATTYQSTQLSIYIGPFRLPVGHQALLPYALCIGPNQQGSGSAKTVCFYWQTFVRRQSRHSLSATDPDRQNETNKVDSLA